MDSHTLCETAVQRFDMKARAIAELVGGELVGDGEREITSGHTLGNAGPSDLAFWDQGGRPGAFPATAAGCVLVGPDVAAPGRTLIRVNEPRNAFARALRDLTAGTSAAPGIHATAAIDFSAEIADDVSVGPHAVVEADVVVGLETVIGAGVFLGAGVQVGAGCHFHAGARVYAGCRLGDRVILHSGACIGADGFGLVFEKDHYEKFPQIGVVEIGNDVEIGANSCVDRGALDDTRIGSGTKLDNLVHIGHNCQIGKHVVMAAQVGLSGGVTVDDYAVLGGQAGIGEGAHIGAKVQLGGQGGLLPDKKLEDGGVFWGTPARPLREHLASQARVNRLPKLQEQIKRLQARVDELEKE